jgi:iron complex outermembrane recepter protein
MRTGVQALSGLSASVRRVITVSGLALLAPPVLAAADNADVGTEGALGPALETVIVTATKREEQLKDVAMSVTALNGEELLRRQESALTDFVTQVPGLSLQALDPGETRIVLRGTNSGGSGATVATIVDDAPFSMSGAQSNGAFFGADVDTYDLQRIEVLRGPQGTLYGATAEGGIIKYVTNPPDPHRFAAEAILGGEVVDGGSTEGLARGMLNLPLWDERAALRISAVEEGQPGWIDDPAAGTRNINDGSKYSLRGSFLVRPVDEFTARVTVFNQHLDLHNSPSVQVVGAALTPQTPPGNQFDQVQGFSNSAPWQHQINTRLTYYALNLRYDFPAASLLSATSYGQIRRDFTGDYTNLNLAPGVSYGDYLGAQVYGQSIIMAQRQSEFLHKFNQELRLTSAPGSELFGQAFDWQTGLFFTHETTTLDQFFDARDATNSANVLEPALGGVTVPAVYKEAALFADVTWHLSPAFDLELGGRETHIRQNSQVTAACCVLFGPDTVFDRLDSSENSVTWSAAPRWHIDPDDMLYARISTGYRPGGPNFPTSTLPTPPSFRPDSTYNYELGLKSTLPVANLQLDVALFDIEWKDIQIISLINTPAGPVGINGNSGRAHSRGVEWDLTWHPLGQLTLEALGSYTNAKLTQDAPVPTRVTGFPMFLTSVRLSMLTIAGVRSVHSRRFWGARSITPDTSTPTSHRRRPSNPW